MRLLAFCVFSIAALAQQNLSSPATVMNVPGGTGELRVRDASGNYFFFANAGKVGINTTTLTDALTVNGSIDLSATSSDMINLPSADNTGATTGGWLASTSRSIIGVDSSNRTLLNISAATGGELYFTFGGNIANVVATLAHSPNVFTVYGSTGDAAINVPINSGFVQSGGGFLSDISGGAYNGFQSLTDGAVMPAYGVAMTAGQKGGYIDLPVLVYPPSGSSPCYDAYANLATYPNGLTGATFAAYAPYNSALTYAQYSIVTSGGSAYYAIISVPTSTAPPNGTYWAPMGGISGGGSLSDVILWNGPSPLSGYVGGSPYHVDGTPCSAPPLTNPLNGLNVSSYVFARYGFATDVESPVAIQVFTGGIQAESYYAGGLYYPGTVTNCCGTLSSPTHLGGYIVLNNTAGVPGDGTGCASIASCNNPLIPGEGVGEGMLYEESTTHHLTVYDSANWRELAYFGDNVTFGTVTGSNGTLGSLTANCGAVGATAFQTDYASAFNFSVDCDGDISVAGAGKIANNSTTGGYGAPNNAARNVYETLGGFESSCATGGNIVFSTSNNDYEVTCAGDVTLNNITINGTCTGSGCGGGSDWSIASTNNLYNNTGIYVIAGGGASAVDDGSHAYLQSKSSVSVTGTVQAIVSGGAIGFQLANSNYEVDSYGDISDSGFLHATGAITSGATAHYFTGGDVGIGVTSPNWLLDVRNGTAVSQIHFVGDNSGAGGFLTSTGGSNAEESGGAYYNGSNWIAAATSAAMVAETGAGVFMYHNTGLTSGASFTLNQIAAFTNTGITLAGTVTAPEFSSTATGSGSGNLSFQTNNGNFAVDGQGNISITGTASVSSVISIQGSNGGLNVTADTAANSIQTVGGVQVFSGKPVVYTAYSVGVLAQAGATSIAATNMASSAPPAGLYQVNAYVLVTSAAASCSGTPAYAGEVIWNDSTGGTQIWLAPQGVGSIVYEFNLQTTGYIQFMPFIMHLNGSYVPQWAIPYLGGGTCSGGYGAYNVYVSMNKID